MSGRVCTGSGDRCDRLIEGAARRVSFAPNVRCQRRLPARHEATGGSERLDSARAGWDDALRQCGG